MQPFPPEPDNFDLEALKNSVFELFNAVRCGLLILQGTNPNQPDDCLSQCTVMFANSTFCNAFNLNLDAIQDKTCEAAFSGASLDLINPLASACRCDGENRTEMKVPGKNLLFEAQVHHLKDGFCAAILYDITALKKSEMELEKALKIIQDEHARAEAILNTITDPLCVISPDFEVVYENEGAKKAWGDNLGRKCYEVYQHQNEACDCQCAKAMADGKVHIQERTMLIKDQEIIYELVAAPIKDGSGKVTRVIELARDITIRKATDRGKERLIMELQAALAKVKRLSGLLPICSYCKKIRDDKGYWNQIESYMRSHAEVEFSHGICEECAQENHPDCFKK